MSFVLITFDVWLFLRAFLYVKHTVFEMGCKKGDSCLFLMVSVPTRGRSRVISKYTFLVTAQGRATAKIPSLCLLPKIVTVTVIDLWRRKTQTKAKKQSGENHSFCPSVVTT